MSPASNVETALESRGVTTQPDLWPLKRLLAARRDTPDSDDLILIRIPKFQRGLVWNDEKRSALIESIYDGFPIGAILLSDAGMEGRARVYHLIDGLQRTTAITDHLQHPLALAPRSVLPD